MKKETILVRRLALGISGSSRIFSCLGFLRCCLWLLGAFVLAGSPAQAAEIRAGDILAVDTVGGTNLGGALFLVNPATGERTVLSDFGNPAQGILGNGDLTGVAVGRRGQIYVGAIFSGDPVFLGGAIFSVDPDTGNRHVVSNLSQGDIQGILYYGLARDASGKVLANLFGPPAAVVRIDPRTDARVLVSDLANPAQGATVDGFITDLTVEHSGKILIAAETNLATPVGIFRVNPRTGKRHLLSDFTNPAQGVDAVDVAFSHGLAVERSRRILVNSGGSVFAPRNLLVRIDPETGDRTILSDFDKPPQGTVGNSLQGLAVEKSGKIVVGAITNSATGAVDVFRVDPNTGQRALLSASDNPAQGPSFRTIVSVAVVPTDRKDEDHEGDGDGEHDD
jgi:hypothetical protein